jgi:hypothetical protein
MQNGHFKNVQNRFFEKSFSEKNVKKLLYYNIVEKFQKNKKNFVTDFFFAQKKKGIKAFFYVSIY